MKEFHGARSMRPRARYATARCRAVVDPAHLPVVGGGWEVARASRPWEEYKGTQTVGILTAFRSEIQSHGRDAHATPAADNREMRPAEPDWADLVWRQAVRPVK